MRSATAVYGYMIVLCLVLIFMIWQMLVEFKIHMVPMGVLVILMFSVSVWDVVKYRRNIVDKGRP